MASYAGGTSQRLGIKKMKTRWGSCNTVRQRVWFNLELAKKPLPCLEYVVVHEVGRLAGAQPFLPISRQCWIGTCPIGNTTVSC